MRIEFLGRAGTIIRSKYLLEQESRRLRVACSLLQGLKQLRLRDWEALPVNVSGWKPCCSRMPVR